MARTYPSLILLLVLFTGCGDMAAHDQGFSGHPHSGPTASHPTGTSERYENYGTNPFVSAEEDGLVTFSVDVDTGSYTLMRRDLSAGRLPVADGVRVEEYVNFFDYQDPAPDTLDEPIRVHTEVATSPFGDEKYLMRVALKGFEVPAEDRPPANLVFLVDVSGSMNAANKLGLVQYALTRLTQTLRPDDQVAIVTYAGRDTVALPPTPIRDRGRVLEAVESLVSGGSTNGAAGILTAYRLAEQAQENRPASINRVILCSDGDFNVGVRGDALLQMIEENRERGISLSVFGFGWGNYNDRDMEQMADRGNGNYAFIDREVEAERVLVKNISGTIMTIAKDTKIQVVINPDQVQRYRLIGYENRDIADEDFRNDAVDAGEIGAGHTVTALIELELKPNMDTAGDVSLAKVIVRYIPGQEQGEDQGVAREILHKVQRRDLIGDWADASSAYRFGAAVAEFAEILRGSEHSTGTGFNRIIEIASQAMDESDVDQREFLTLVRGAQMLWPSQ